MASAKSNPTARTLAACGCLAAIVGVFLPWGPSGKSVLTEDMANAVRGKRITNTTGQPMDLGQGQQLLPGEELMSGPFATARIVTPEKTTRAVLGEAAWGLGQGAWGYVTLMLALAGLLLTLPGLALKPWPLSRVLLPLCAAAGMVVPAVMVWTKISAAVRKGSEFGTAMYALAPFGEFRFCWGLGLAILGCFVAFFAGLAVMMRGKSRRRRIHSTSIRPGIGPLR